MKPHPTKQNIKVAVDNAIFTVKDGVLHILMIQMKKKPYTDMWALPGGLVADDETLEQATKRILKEQTGVANVYSEQLYSFGRPDRDKLGRVVSVAYMALIPSRSVSLKTSTKYNDVKWIPVGSLPALAYDHKQIARYAHRRLKAKLSYTNVVYSLLPKSFTLTQMQRAYEAVLGDSLDKRNFRKKVLSLKLIKKTGKKSSGGAHRPASLYEFVSTQPKEVQLL